MQYWLAASTYKVVSAVCRKAMFEEQNISRWLSQSCLPLWAVHGIQESSFSTKDKWAVITDWLKCDSMETENWGEGRVARYYSAFVCLSLNIQKILPFKKKINKSKTCLFYLLEKRLCAYWKIQKFPKLRSCQRNNEQMNVSLLKTLFDPWDAVLILPLCLCQLCAAMLQLE